MTKEDIIKGDIWLVNLDPSRKSELGKSSRPCIVIQADEANRYLPTIAIVPLSTRKQKLELAIKISPDKINNLKKESYVVWWHIYTVGKSSLIKKIGAINDELLVNVSENIIDTLGFSSVLS